MKSRFALLVVPVLVSLAHVAAAAPPAKAPQSTLNASAFSKKAKGLGTPIPGSFDATVAEAHKKGDRHIPHIDQCGSLADEEPAYLTGHPGVCRRCDHPDGREEQGKKGGLSADGNANERSVASGGDFGRRGDWGSGGHI